MAPGTPHTHLVLVAAAGAAGATVLLLALGFRRPRPARARKELRTVPPQAPLPSAAKGPPPHTTRSEYVQIEDVFVMRVPNLGELYEPEGLDNTEICDSGAHYMNIVSDSDVVLTDIVRQRSLPKLCRAFVRAGPRKTLHFNPANVRAAIVTCGGLCPGLNNVVREITQSLHFLYGAKTILGVIGGYSGFQRAPVTLTPQSVSLIHHQGGTLLSSSRGGFDLHAAINFLTSRKVSQLYVIGGDGTHRGALRLAQECERLRLNVAVVGIPKTIDNDVALIDRSFGFETAIEAAQAAIASAKVEATCNIPNGIGIVKLMGRSTGFIAAFATMASGDVDLCLVPEVPIELEGEYSCLTHLEKCIARKGHAVVVVAEGAGEGLMEEVGGADASGNKKLPPVGVWLKDKIIAHFESKSKEVTVKYIDPSYMIRSVKANASDSLYCMQLGQNAVHGAMAGYTGISVGLCNNRMVYLPIPAMVEASPRGMRQFGRSWERVLSITHQPNRPVPVE